MYFQYKIEDNQFQLVEVDNGKVKKDGFGIEAIHTRNNEIAILFDSEHGTLHKHGERSMVENYFNHCARLFVRAGLTAIPLTMVTIPPIVDLLPDLNRCLTTTGYCKRFYEKLQNDPRFQANNLTTSVC